MTHALIRYRQNRNMTQRELAIEIGVNASTLVRIEKNVGSYSVRKILAWCEKNQVNPGDIFPPKAAA